MECRKSINISHVLSKSAEIDKLGAVFPNCHKAYPRRRELL
jgi:hypothetical protein